MDYTEEMVLRLKKMSTEQLEVLQREWKKRYAGKEVMAYLNWLIEKVKFIKK